MYQGGLTLTECQVLTKASPSTTGQREHNRRLRCELSTGRDHSPIATVGTADLTWRYLLKLSPSKIKAG